MPAPVVDLVESLRRDPHLGRQLVHVETLPGVPPRTGELDPPLPPPLARALAAQGIEKLWSHQTEGIAAARAGRDVLVTTPTASGKSLIFQTPVLEEALRGGTGKALFLFPLKALGQDQKAKLDALSQALERSGDLAPGLARCEIYDGDTPKARRLEIKSDFPRVVVTNPDMLHLAVLSYWSGWREFLADLRWVVLDELHTYRGIFGSHFHHVLQRFFRLARLQGAEPGLIASSATAANADEFAGALTGRSFHWITGSGAPRERRHFLLIRPESSPYTTTLHLFINLLKAGLKTIVFTKARRITELLYSWLRRQEPDLAKKVASYRAGFLPEERRKIESELFEGVLDGVISTSALEMGIDVGGLDACILVGYPGSMMATWQRSGRVGRAESESITALVALPDALDQYLLDHPQEIFSRPCERLIVDPTNEPVTRRHLVCAAAESPLRKREDGAYLERHAALVGDLLRGHELLEAADGDGGLYSVRRRPQRGINLRGGGATYSIVDEVRDRVIGTVDGVRALHECHPGAVYLHGGRQYVIRDLDLEERRALAVRTEVDYFTTPMTEKETEILETLAEGEEGPLSSRLGRLKVTERVVGYERKRIQNQEPLDQRPLELPPVEFETVGLWWVAGAEIEESLRPHSEHFLGALHAAEHAAISLYPLLALCDRGDIGGISFPFHPQVGTGAVFIYDGHPGGVGIAARAFEELPELLARVQALVEGCPCETGCPSCIQSPKCGNGNRPLDKAGAARALRILLGREKAVEVPAEARERWAVAKKAEKPERRRRPPRLDKKQAEVEPETPIAATRGRSGRAPRKAPRPEKVENTVLFDLETLRSASDVGGWNKAHKMGIAVGVVCFLEEGRVEIYREEGVPALIEDLSSADLVVGFNSKRFDYRVLSGYTGVDYERVLPSLDLLEEIHRRLGFRLGLNHLAAETLGAKKSADGLQSLEWVKEGRFDLVEDYCRKDVEILRDLYLYGRREGHVLYRDKKRDLKLKLEVDW